MSSVFSEAGFTSRELVTIPTFAHYFVTWAYSLRVQGIFDRQGTRRLPTRS